MPNVHHPYRQPTPRTEVGTAHRARGVSGRPRPGTASTPSRTPPDRPTLGARVIAVVTLGLLAANIVGARYYLLPIGDRVRSPLHPILKPSGSVGQAAGLISLAIFVFLWLYPLRKKVRWLAFTGSVGRWMEVHIVAALTLPLLLAIHAAWRFGGVIGLGFWAMMIVCASGIVGRYLYVRIPRSRNGVELSLEEVAGQRRALVQRLADVTGLDLADVQAVLGVVPTREPPTHPFRAIQLMLVNDLHRWQIRRQVARRWDAQGAHMAALDRRTLDEVAECAAREAALAQQVALLHSTQRIFRWWHVAHRPIALTALIAVVIHVVVVVATGVTWLW